MARCVPGVVDILVAMTAPSGGCSVSRCTRVLEFITLIVGRVETRQCNLKRPGVRWRLLEFVRSNSSLRMRRDDGWTQRSRAVLVGNQGIAPAISQNILRITALLYSDTLQWGVGNGVGDLRCLAIWRRRLYGVGRWLNLGWFFIVLDNWVLAWLTSQRCE